MDSETQIVVNNWMKRVYGRILDDMYNDQILEGVNLSHTDIDAKALRELWREGQISTVARDLAIFLKHRDYEPSVVYM